MRAFFDLVEANRIELPEAELARLEPALLLALRRAGIVRDGDPGRVEVSLPDLGRTLRTLYGALSRGLTLPSTVDERPVLLGWTGEGATQREIVLVAQPARALAWALRRPWRCLVLLPTARELTVDVRERHARGALVEVEALEEVLVVRGGRLLRKEAPRTRSKAASVSSEGSATPRVRRAAATVQGASALGESAVPTVETGKAFLAGAQRWNQVRLCLVSSALLRVDLPGRSVRCTAADMGMVSARSRKPTVVWEALVAICEDHGYFKTTRFGGIAATKKVISRLRARLHDVFDLSASPFRRYRRGTGWQARFDARPDLPGDTAGGSFRDSRRVPLGDKSASPAEGDDDFFERDPSTRNDID
jgi:hypothetical protein